MGLLYGRAGRLTDKNGGFRPRAEKLEGLGTAEDCFLPGPAQASVQARPGRNHFDQNNQC